jgi:hypothetical protein
MVIPSMFSIEMLRKKKEGRGRRGRRAPYHPILDPPLLLTQDC